MPFTNNRYSQVATQYNINPLYAAPSGDYKKSPLKHSKATQQSTRRLTLSAQQSNYQPLNKTWHRIKNSKLFHISQIKEIKSPTLFNKKPSITKRLDCSSISPFYYQSNYSEPTISKKQFYENSYFSISQSELTFHDDFYPKENQAQRTNKQSDARPNNNETLFRNSIETPQSLSIPMEYRNPTTINQRINMWDDLEKKTYEHFTNSDNVRFKNEQSYNYAEQMCPKNTYVYAKSKDKNREYHANYVSLISPNGTTVKVIAAQQPKANQEGIAKFKKLLRDTNTQQVFDLRNSTDMSKGHLNPSYAEPGKNSIEIKNQHLSKGSKPTSTKSINIIKYRNWEDQNIISPNELRDLKDQLNRNLEIGKNILIHCRAGVGRTGTLIAYTSLYNDFKLNRPANQSEALSRVSDKVFKLRQERGQSVVQTDKQLNLIIDTLLQDFNL